jgi:eukaryotic-like serine/threonine-protein kinase
VAGRARRRFPAGTDRVCGNKLALPHLFPRREPAGLLSELLERRYLALPDRVGNTLPAHRLLRRRPQYSPDGKHVLFCSARAGEKSTIWIANADGSNPVQVTDRIQRSAGSPRWSPDGKSIAFDSLEPDGTQNIYLVDATGGQPRPITNHPSSNGLPSWSRDGKWVYFFSDRTGQREIWRVPSTGGASERVTTAGGNTAFESVDGKTLYYTKNVPGPMFARSLDGGPERKLDIVVGTTRDFAVFEDGIYYGGPRTARITPIQFYSFATGKSRLLLETDGNVFYGLSVSPDRKTILFAKTVSFGADLMIVDSFR